MDPQQRLLIVEEVRLVMARYAYLADQRDWKGLAGLYTAGGFFEPHKPDGSVWLTLRGPVEIEAGLRDSSGPRDVLIHHLFSYEVDVESEEAAHIVVAMEDLIFRSEDEEPPADFPFRTMHGFGHYHADVVRTPDGWRIARLVQTRLRLDFGY